MALLPFSFGKGHWRLLEYIFLEELSRLPQYPPVLFSCPSQPSSECSCLWTLYRELKNLHSILNFLLCCSCELIKGNTRLSVINLTRPDQDVCTYFAQYHIILPYNTQNVSLQSTV